MANPAEPISGQICWPSPGSFTGHQRAHQLAARGQKQLAIDTLLSIAAKEALALYGVEFPAAVEVGDGLRVMHWGFGTVIHPSTKIGANVIIYQCVTIGLGDPWVPGSASPVGGVVIEDDAVLCAGAKIICNDGILTVRRGTIVGANAVLTRSTPEPDGVWAGVPARRIKNRT